jgi:hypothetical protein
MEQGDPTTAFQCFEDAIKHNPNDPDIYYHRGQGTLRAILNFLNGTNASQPHLQYSSSWASSPKPHRTTPNPRNSMTPSYLATSNLRLPNTNLVKLPIAWLHSDELSNPSLTVVNLTTTSTSSSSPPRSSPYSHTPKKRRTPARPRPIRRSHRKIRQSHLSRKS